MKAGGGDMSSSTLSFTSALYGEFGQRHSFAALPPGMTRYPSCSGWMDPDNPAPSGFDPRNFQPVATRYTDDVIPAHRYIKTK